MLLYKERRHCRRHLARVPDGQEANRFSVVSFRGLTRPCCKVSTLIISHWTMLGVFSSGKCNFALPTYSMKELLALIDVRDHAGRLHVLVVSILIIGSPNGLHILVVIPFFTSQ